MDDTIKLTLELALEVRALHRGRPDDKRNRSRTGEECECEELRLRRGCEEHGIAVKTTIGVT